MPKGGTIVISARRTKPCKNEPGLKPGHYVCLAVTDTGTGMDEETLRRATEPFYTTKGVGKGTGLGLPMVLGMTEQSGGKLISRASLDEGTTVELCLPVVASRRGCRRKRHLPAPPHPSGAPSGSSASMTIRWSLSIPRRCWRNSGIRCSPPRAARKRSNLIREKGRHRPADHRPGDAGNDRIRTRRSGTQRLARPSDHHCHRLRGIAGRTGSGPSPACKTLLRAGPCEAIASIDGFADKPV